MMKRDVIKIERMARVTPIFRLAKRDRKAVYPLSDSVAPKGFTNIFVIKLF